jgi:Tfp pilus assembly PilM family ATPase
VSTWFGHKISPIGVDVDGRYLRAAQTAPHGQGHTLQAAVSIPRVAPEEPLGDRDVAQLKGTLGRLGFRGNRLVLAVPEDKLAVDILELPPRGSGAPVDTIARTELARTHNYEPAAAEMISWDLPPSPRARDITQMMAVALTHADADALLAVFDRADLDVVALDTPMAATVRACRPMIAPTGLTVVLNVGWDWAMLLVLLSGTVVYRRLMPENSVRLLTQAIARNLDLPAPSVDCLLQEVGLADDVEGSGDTSVPLDSVRTLIQKPFDAVAEAVRGAFAYAGQMYAGAAAGEVLLTGQAAAIPGVDEYLESNLGATVRVAVPGDVAAPAPGTEKAAADPSLTATAGLALYQEERHRAKPQSHSVATA